MTQRELAARVPELARWVELRSMLLGERARLFGGTADFVAVDRESGLAVLYGDPAPAVIATALAGAREAVAAPENAPALAGWTRERAILYRLEREPEGGEAAVRLVTAGEIGSWAMPALLHDELRRVSRYCPVAAAFAGSVPASFCYALESETLFDLSIDTLAEHRGRGCATAAAAWMIRYQRQRGRDPVWGALESNTASHRTAARLGFVPADELMAYSRALD